MDAHNSTNGISRRRLLAGAAAGMLGYPLLRSTAGAAVPPAAAPRPHVIENAEDLVSGTFHPSFQRVRDQFVENFRNRNEVGASVHVIVDGEVVVDLWGGVGHVGPWTQDQLVQVWSTTKGATSLCAHILADRGLLDLDAPVVQYWPEFGQQGKEATTVAMLMSHQAGVPAIRGPLPRGSFYDWQYMVDRLAAEPPFWEPGTQVGYHALTFGFLVGELVRRISGKSLGTFFRDEVAGPLGLEFWIGLPQELEPRVTPTIFPPLPPAGDNIFFDLAYIDPTSIPYLVIFNNGLYMFESDTRPAHAAEIGASGGITNARSLARMYESMAGGAGATPLIGRDTIARLSSVASATGKDATGQIKTRWGLGYVKSMDNRRGAPGAQDSVIIGENAFGHSGFGGSVGFADPSLRLAFGYTMNNMGQGTALTPRGQALVDAVYESLDADLGPLMNGCAADRAEHAQPLRKLVRGVDRKLSAARRLTERFERKGKVFGACADEIDVAIGGVQSPLGALVK